MTRSKLVSFEEAARLIPDGAVVAASSSSGLACPDRMLAAIGERFAREGRPRDLTFFLPIAAGDMYGIKGIDHVARKGLLKSVIAGSYPSGPSSMASPAIWQMIAANEVAAYNVPSGILFDMCREAAARRAGVMTRVGLDTFVDPRRNGCKMNDAARADIVKLVEFDGGEWLHFPNVYPQVAIIRGTTADEAGNISMEHEGAYPRRPRRRARGAELGRHRDRAGEAHRARAARSRRSAHTCPRRSSTTSSSTRTRCRRRRRPTTRRSRAKRGSRSASSSRCRGARRK